VVETDYKEKTWLQLTMSMEKLTKGKMKMTKDNQKNNLEIIHNKKEAYAKASGKQKKMSDEDFDKEMVELKSQLSNIK